MTNKEQIWAERKAFVVDFFKSASIGLIVIFIALGIFAAFRVLGSGWDTALSNKMSEVNDLAMQVTRTTAKIRSLEDSLDSFSGGIDLARKTEDDQRIFDILNEYGSWSSISDLSAKSRTFSQSGLSLGSFRYFILPAIYKDGIGTDRVILAKIDGETDTVYQKILGAETYLSAVTGNTYSYYAAISYDRVFGKDVSVSGGIVFLAYDVAGDGTISVTNVSYIE